MFAVIYRGFILPEHEEAYCQAWRQVAAYFVTHCGALGSTLHRSHDGEYIAYSRWPDKHTRDKHWGEHAQFQGMDSLQADIETLRNALDKNKPFDEIAMEIIDYV